MKRRNKELKKVEKDGGNKKKIRGNKDGNG